MKNRLAKEMFEMNPEEVEITFPPRSAPARSLEEFPLAKMFGWKKFDTKPLFIFPPRCKYLDGKTIRHIVERYGLQSIDTAEFHPLAAENARNVYDPHVERYGFRRKVSNA